MGVPSKTWGMVMSVIVVLASVALGILPIVAPSGHAGVSIERTVDHVGAVARQPHAMGTPEIAEVRDYLIATLVEMGLTPETQAVDAPDYFGTPGATVVITNVMTRIRGVESNEAVLLMAHYDTAPTTPGANDNSAAVSALLETGRALVEHPPPNDVILLFTDGEEPTPRFGASAFTEHPWFDDIAVVANFEGIGVGGPALLVELNGPASPLLDRLVKAVPHPAVFSFLTQTAELIGGAATDFDVFRDAGIPGYNLAYLRGPSIYHTDRDIPSSLNTAGMEHQASIALGMARDLGPLHLEPSDQEAVFFTIPGWSVVRYDGRLAFASAILAATLVGWALIGRIRRGDSSIGRLGAGTLLVVVGSLIAVSAMSFLWIGIVELRNYMGIVEGYLWLLALAAGLIGCWYLILQRSKRSGADLAGGATLAWTLLAVVTGFWLPSMSYLFVWPAVFGAVVLVGRPLIGGPTARIIALAVVTLPSALVLTPAVDIFFQFANPRPGNPDSELPAAVAVSLLLLILSIGLIQTTTTSTEDASSRKRLELFGSHGQLYREQNP